jgi:hypothetical protein
MTSLNIESTAPRVTIAWIPLGAGASVVRTSGRMFESLAALVARRQQQDLFHSALLIDVPEGRYIVEMAPVVDRNGAARGVVAEGPVGLRWAGSIRLFRYEIRRWKDGVIGDLSSAVALTHIPMDLTSAYQLLEVVTKIPTPVWGRDELDAGEMWNSNSVISWALGSLSVDLTNVQLPTHGRAPGWTAGQVIAARQRTGALTGLPRSALSHP